MIAHRAPSRGRACHARIPSPEVQCNRDVHLGGLSGQPGQPQLADPVVTVQHDPDERRGIGKTLGQPDDMIALADLVVGEGEESRCGVVAQREQEAGVGELGSPEHEPRCSKIAHAKHRRSASSRTAAATRMAP